YICLSRDMSSITRPEQFRMYACITTNKKEMKQYHIQTLTAALLLVLAGTFGLYDRMIINW
ncbi:hypothetical protein, partial [Bacteroides sp. 51]|uniref:hypothetical protein n=1 Tax=Bacteroides sp. 51 TaxID=2302938 RepID=UPI00351B85EC